MAHFAQLDSNNLVLQVICLENSILENEQGQPVEQLGINFLQNLYGSNTIWAQTSYNTRAGIYHVSSTNEADPDQSKAFRKNFAGIGYSYDSTRNAFINPKPSVSLEHYVWVYISSNPHMMLNHRYPLLWHCWQGL